MGRVLNEAWYKVKKAGLAAGVILALGVLVSVTEGAQYALQGAAFLSIAVFIGVLLR